MAKAFLSHSSSDKKQIGNIAQKLGPQRCHYDALTFEAGERTMEEIFAALEDTDIFVLFLSERALESQWVKKEISTAKTLLDKKVIDRIFPLIIDSKIEYNDPRIPNWIKKPYNIRHFNNEVLILQKINQLLREANFKKYSHLRDLNQLFIGRHKLISDFETKISPIDSSIPSCIIAYNFFEGIGRRSFLKNALVRTNVIDSWYEPIPIPLSSKESIEDFIYKLNFIDKSPEIYDLDLTAEELTAKIEIARKLLLKFNALNEIIFIIDTGGIILPNNQITPWFIKIMESEEFKDRICICIVSKFKPHPRELRNLRHFAAFQVDELSPPEIQTLFVQYLKHLGVDISEVDKKLFLKQFHGLPKQVVYTANLIASVGVPETKLYLKEIEEFDEGNVKAILRFLGEDSLAVQILIALSRLEIISYNLVFRIFGESSDVIKAIQQIFDLGLFYNVTPTHEYLKLNTTLADFINRSRIDLSPEFEKKFRDIVNTALESPITLDADTDYSQFLLTIQEMILAKQPIPSKFFLPSFILKAITEEYYQHRYKNVIELAQRLIDTHQKFDTQIIREARYWLCLAYCKVGDPKLFDEIKYFKEEDQFGMKDFYFLLGFYYRNTDDMEMAEKYFNKALEIDAGHSRTKRELINVYLRQHEFKKALRYAEDNYEQYPNNIYHINAYFTCLIKVSELRPDDIGILDELLEKTRTSIDRRAPEFYSTMESEYEYYVQKNKTKAIRNLKEALRIDKNDYHAYKALLEIYRKEGMEPELDGLIENYVHLAKKPND